MLPVLHLTPANLIQCLFIFLGALGSCLLYYQARFKGVMYVLIYFAVLMAFNLLEELGISKAYIFITPSFTLLLGPIIYYMVNDIVIANNISNWVKLKHAAPFLLSTFFAEQVTVVVAIGSVSQLLYLNALYKLLQRYDLAAVNVCSDAGSLQLQWLEKTCIAIILFLLIDMVRLNSRFLLTDKIYYSWYVFDLALLLLICCYLLIKSATQQALFSGLEEFEKEFITDDSNNNASKNDDATLNEKAKETFQIIDKIVDSNALFKTPNLTVLQVAQFSGLSAKDTSWIINQVSGKNFNDYINAKRVEAVKVNLKPQNMDTLSILQIAFDSGFNSKSTFNLAFKKVEGMTPSQYAKQHR